MKKVQGVGVNDSGYRTQYFTGGKRVWICPFYKTWKDMLVRAYSEREQKRYPRYEGCSVCEEWLTFSNFKAWMEVQEWEGCQLDKDLLFPGNKIYSPETCLFVPQEINKFLTESTASRGEWPIGVHFKKSGGTFHSQVNNPFTKIREYLGSFDSPEEAHLAWLKRKSELATELAKTQSDDRVAAALIARYENYKELT